jgi:predicted TIM-barrel fold metal-dependent hydrolase
MPTSDSLSWGNKDGPVTFLPEPEPRSRRFTIISVDDHLVEPSNVFEGRVPTKYAELVPRLIEQDDGSQVWLFEDRIIPMAGNNARSGRPPREYNHEPLRYEQMRDGCFDVHARVKDMDLGGIWASLCFPSTVAGFGGARFSEAKDHEVGIAAMRAWNDWHIESWAGAYPERFIPLQVGWLRDPVLGAEEIRKNAAKGFRAVSFPEMPEKLGLPSIHTGYWDPVFKACEETGTVICLHVGSSSWMVGGSSDAPPEVVANLFYVGSIITTTDWLFSKVAVRFPDIRIVISEGGIDWVPALIDRVEHCFRYREFTGGWVNEDLHPLEVLRRNFWFCALDDAAGFEILDRIGADRVMVECDYPHADSTWPDTQEYLDRQLGFLPTEDTEKVTWKNASHLFRFEIPERVKNRKWHSDVATANPVLKSNQVA